jgi:hypothetical protein
MCILTSVLVLLLPLFLCVFVVYTESPLTGSLIGTGGSWSSAAKLLPIKNEGFAVQTQVKQQ